MAEANAKGKASQKIFFAFLNRLFLSFAKVIASVKIGIVIITIEEIFKEQRIPKVIALSIKKEVFLVFIKRAQVNTKSRENKDNQISKVPKCEYCR